MSERNRLGERAQAAAAALLGARDSLVSTLLDQRRGAVAAIASAGGIASPRDLIQVKEREEQLRHIDEALGILRYGA